MYLRQVTYQLGVRLKSLIPCFHKSHVENLVLLVIGIAYSRGVSMPKAAQAVPYNRTQVESRVQRFERLLQCGKFIPLEVLTPIAKKVLRSISRSGRVEIHALMDRSMINDTINLLHISVAYHGRALPLGWVRVPHEGSSDLKLQQKLLTWFKQCLPRKAQAVIVADREFHSIHLAEWIEKDLGLSFALRIKAGTTIEYDGITCAAGGISEERPFLFVRSSESHDRSERILPMQSSRDLGSGPGRALAADNKSDESRTGAPDLSRALLDRRNVFRYQKPRLKSGRDSAQASRST